MTDVAFKHGRKRQGIRSGVVCMVNDTGILIVYWIRGNNIRVGPRCVIMDSRAQPVMIGKKLGQEVALTVDNYAPCQFTIVTFTGHVKWTIGYTREPLQLCFQVKPRDPLAYLIIRCAVTDAINYDILVDQQALYIFGFGLDN